MPWLVVTDVVTETSAVFSQLLLLLLLFYSDSKYTKREKR